jgi:hypothetical protein
LAIPKPSLSQNKKPSSAKNPTAALLLSKHPRNNTRLKLMLSKQLTHLTPRAAIPNQLIPANLTA